MTKSGSDDEKVIKVKKLKERNESSVADKSVLLKKADKLAKKLREANTIGNQEDMPVDETAKL